MEPCVLTPVDREYFYLSSYTVQALQIPDLKQVFFSFEKYCILTQKSAEYV